MTSRELCARCLVKMDTREGYSNLVLVISFRVLSNRCNKI